LPSDKSGGEKDKRSIKPPFFIQTLNLTELGRLACALERVPLPLFAMRNNGKSIIATQLDLFIGAPVFYYAETNEIKHYLGYRTAQATEEVALVDSPSNLSFAYAPVIEIEEMPEVFEKGLKSSGSRRQSGQKFLSVKLKDLTGLMKVASYKILFEEPPLPIFAFPSSDGSSKWKLGSFTRMEDYEEASIFFYFEREGKPDQNFVKYSMTNAESAFTNRSDEHGNLYVKLIRLKEPHPLVDSN
jgi:hypothetical protein